MTILTPRLTLVPITDTSLAQEDSGALPDLPEVEITDWPPEHWEPHVFPYIRKQYAEHPHTRGWHRYIILSSTGTNPSQLIGTLGASPKPEGDAEIGYSILPAFQRQGFGTEAAKAFVAWLARQSGVLSISAQTYPSLPASIRVMESCGLTPAGTGDEEGAIRYRKLLTSAAQPE